MSDTDEIAFQRKCAQFIDRNVLCCVSGLVHTLVKEYHDNEARLIHAKNLCEQAAELSYPVEDYEEAARQAGWVLDNGIKKWWNPGNDDGSRYCDNERAFPHICEDHNIDPHEWEVYEQWAVTDYFAEKLREHGERVGELDNLTIWGRTTTGQAISMDSVIRSIVKGL